MSWTSLLYKQFPGKPAEEVSYNKKITYRSVPAHMPCGPPWFRHATMVSRKQPTTAYSLRSTRTMREEHKDRYCMPTGHLQGQNTKEAWYQQVVLDMSYLRRYAHWTFLSQEPGMNCGSQNQLRRLARSWSVSVGCQCSPP